MPQRFAVSTFLILSLGGGVALIAQESPAPSLSAHDAPSPTVEAPKPAAAAAKSDAVAEPAEAPEVEAIRAASQAFVQAFNSGNSKAVAACWTPDGAYVDDSGATYDGREAIEAEYAAFFKANPDAKIRLFVDSIRLLSESAAIEDGRAFVDSPDGAEPVYGKYVAIHVKVDGEWLMSMVRDDRIEVASAYANVADLEWLIGEWSAEDRGAKMTSVCRWVANKSFVERRYAVTGVDGTTTAGVQIIGWNPAAGQMQSWTFSSDGGHAVGAWSPVENGWVAEVVGVTGAGASTRAINRLTRLDDAAYAWQSTDRTVDGQSLPDSAEIVMKRVSENP